MYTTSLNIADNFYVSHSEVLQQIDIFLDELCSSVDNREEVEVEQGFLKVSYTAKDEKHRIKYWITEDAVMFLIMSYSMPNTLKTKLAYKDAFEKFH